MGGGDLNFKKSWHPQRQHNMEKVWLEEQKAKEEEKRLEQLRKEIEEQRRAEELEQLQEQAGLKKRSNKLEWMYAAGPIHQVMEKEEKESYLLGEKKVDKILSGGKKIEGENNLSTGAALDLTNANNLRDTQAKIREDPLLVIKRMEKASLQRLLNNPIKLAHIKESKKSKHKSKKEKSERTVEYEYDGSKDERYSRERRNHSDRGDDRKYRDRRSPSRHDRDYNDDKYKSSYRYENRNNHNRSSARSPKDTYHSSRHSLEHRARNEPRSRSPHSKRESRNYSPRHYNKHETSYRNNMTNYREHEKDEKTERERKLKKMMEDAERFDDARQKRVATLKQEEALEEAEQARSYERNKRGGVAPKMLRDMNNKIYNSTDALSLEKRLNSRKGRLDIGD